MLNNDWHCSWEWVFLSVCGEGSKGQRNYLRSIVIMVIKEKFTEPWLCRALNISLKCFSIFLINKEEHLIILSIENNMTNNLHHKLNIPEEKFEGEAIKVESLRKYSRYEVISLWTREKAGRMWKKRRYLVEALSEKNL